MKLTPTRWGPLALALALMLIVPHAAAEAQDAQSAQNAQAAPAAVEGLQLHGHWTIEVYDGDELVERREFDNALTTEGARHLMEILGGYATPGRWAIELLGDGMPCPRLERLVQGACFPVITGEQLLYNETVGGWYVRDRFENPNGETTITEVQTVLFQCSPFDTTDACTESPETATYTWETITQHTLDTPVAAARNQAVVVTVVLTLN